MDICNLLCFSKEIMSKVGISSPALESEILLSAVLKKNKEYLLANPKDKISFWLEIKFKRLLKKRLDGYSLACLTGRKWFYGLDFFVNKNVLIPRPETELMIDFIRNCKFPITDLIDVGTGSGCIIIALANILDIKNIKFYGLDISRKALKVAKKNAKKNKVDGCINFLYSDLLEKIDFKKTKGAILIAANLPYLSPEQIKNSPSIQKEPRIALESGSEGLNHYCRLFEQLKAKEKNKGVKIILCCEIDESQKNVFSNLVKKIFPTAKLVFKKDLNGDDRLAVINL